MEIRLQYPVHVRCRCRHSKLLSVVDMHCCVDVRHCRNDGDTRPSASKQCRQLRAVDHPFVDRHVNPDHHGRPHLGLERQTEREGCPSLGHVDHEQERSIALASLVS